ncbi:hypothetical protein [Pseudomonas sp. M30-35]|uniref:hypothetical protein n=1 Tax=Pseudomonas sp. M30-35 TaxID=1981174 RepID=UPI000B3C71C8|nr:hypothetical protein [Pseudomonas sp. M30-35]ARU87651.1 hypothetical protein B9K09_06590 [Pseudomonas sp. M30-35]
MTVSASPRTLERGPRCAGADDVKLYSVAAIALATLLGSPLAGAFVMQHNFNVLGRRHQSFRLWGIAISLFVAAFFICAFLPETFGAQLLIVLETLVMSVYAKRSFAGSVELQGKAFYSNWRVVGICLLLLLVMLVAIIEVTLFLNLF